MFDHEIEKEIHSQSEYYHKDFHVCPVTGKEYDLSHLFSYKYIHHYDDGSSITCKVTYRTHVYTKGVRHHEINSAQYIRDKVINIEHDKRAFKDKGMTKHTQYRFFSESRYRLSLELNHLLAQCYNNQIRFNSSGSDKNPDLYTAYPYLKSTNDESKYYCIFLSAKRDRKLPNLIHIRIESAYIETRDATIKSHLGARKIKFSTIMNKLK